MDFTKFIIIHSLFIVIVIIVHIHMTLGFSYIL